MKNEKYLNLHIQQNKKYEIYKNVLLKNVTTVTKKDKTSNRHNLINAVQQTITIQKMKQYKQVVVQNLLKAKILTNKLNINIPYVIYIYCVYMIITNKKKWDESTKQ